MLTLNSSKPSSASAKKDWDIQVRINRRVKEYLNQYKFYKGNHPKIWFKLAAFCAGIICCYVIIFIYSLPAVLVLAYFGILSLSLVMAMTIGHDAAHGAVTRKQKIDGLIYWLIFAFNGVNPGTWKKRHNGSHHHFPNVQGLDCDLALSRFIYLSADQKKTSVHKYQHLYAPFLYLFFSLAWISMIDFLQHKESLANDKSRWSIAKEWAIFLLIKCNYIFVLIALPAWLSAFSLQQILITWLVIQMVLSVFLSFTFFMSHHIKEAAYFNNQLDISWLENQIASTVDFHGQSEIANFIFGGFHAHVAHHLFPNVSHIHYPKLTHIIREELAGTHIRYQSINFFHGVMSHLELLRQKGA